MEKLLKKRVPIYNGNKNMEVNVYAYELATAGQDNTYVAGPGPPITPLQIAHNNAAYNVALATTAGAAAGSGGGVASAIGGGLMGLVVSGTNQCWTSCHQSSPTKQP